MIKLAICDDNAFFCDELSGYIRDNFSSDIDIIEEFHDGKSLIEYIDETHIVFDIILLDLRMEGMSGIDAGYHIRKNVSFRSSVIFFITSFDANPSPIVDIHPFAYIKKPLNYEDFGVKFAEAIEMYKDDENFIVISTHNRTVRPLVRDIVYFTSGYRNTKIHTVHGDIDINISLRKLEKLITERSHVFTRINANTIINVRYLHDTGTDYVILNDSEKSKFRLSRTYRMPFLSKCQEILFH